MCTKKQRRLNACASVLRLRVDPTTREKRNFPLYQERDLFKAKERDILRKLKDNGCDDDIGTDDETVKR